MEKVHYCLSPWEYEVSLYPTVAYVIRIKKTLRFFDDFGKGGRIKSCPYLALARHFWVTSSRQFLSITKRLNQKGVAFEIIRFEIPLK